MATAAVLNVLVLANTNQATRSLLRFNTTLKATETSANKAVGALQTIGKGAAIGVGAGLAFAVKKAADFEQQLDSLGAVTEASAKDMERFRKQAMKAGADTKFSALDAAAAQTELAKGGLSVRNILRGGLRSALALAAAGEMDLAEAAATTANSMNLFGLRGKDSIKVADALAKAANDTTADVEDFAMALRQGGGVAKTAGLSFQETVLALEALAKSGVKNSDAGTSLKTSLIQLLSPTAKQRELMQKLNLDFTDAAGNFKNLSDISDMLREKTKGMTREQRLATFATIAGTDGVRTLTALYDAGSGKLDKWRKGLGQSGTAADVAAKKQDNLKGKLENLQGSLETIAIGIGSKLLPSLTDYAEQLTDILNAKGLSGEEKFGRITQLLANAVGKGFAAGGAAAIKAAPGMAKGFVNAFIDADVWGKLAIGAGGGFLATKLGLTGPLLKLLTGRGGRDKLGGGGGALGGLLNKPVPVVVTNPGFGAPGKGPGGKLGPGAAAGAGAGLASKVPPSLRSGGGVAPVIAAIKITSDFFKDKSDLGLLDQFADDIERVAQAGDGPGMRNLANKMREVADANKDQTKGEHLRRFADQLDLTASKGGKDLSGLIRLFRNLPKVTGSSLPQVGSHLAQASTATGKLGDKTKNTTDRVKSARGPMDNLKAAAKRLADQAGVATGKVGRLGNEVRDLPSRKKMQVLVDIGIQGLNIGKGFLGGGGSGDGWGIQTGIEQEVRGRLKQKDPMSLLGVGGLMGAPGGSAGLMGANPILAPFAKLGSRFGLSVTSGFRPGSITNSGNVSYHASGHAIDVNAGSAGQMLAYAKVMASAFGSRLKELIHTPLGFSIKNGQRVPPYAQADHYDHVHVAMQAGGVVPGSGSGDKVPVAAMLEPGEHFAVLNRNAAKVWERINGMFPRFQKGGNLLAGLNKVFPAHNLGQPGAQLSSQQVRAVAERWGRLSPARALQADQITQGESNRHPGIIGHDPGGTLGIGLWQITRGVQGALGKSWIDSRGGDTGMRNPKKNAEVMSLMSNRGSSWSNWYGTRFLKPIQKNVKSVFAGVAGVDKGKSAKAKRKVSSFLSKLGSSNVPSFIGPTAKALRRQITMLQLAADTAGEMAGRAETLEGPVNGKDQVGWLNDQLKHLFALRNKLVDMHDLVMRRRDAYAEAVQKARKRLERVRNDIEKAAKERRRALEQIARERKSKKPDKQRIKRLREKVSKIELAQAGRVKERQNLIKQVIPGLDDRRKGASSNLGTWTDRLVEVQGLGSPMTRMSALPAVGVLGGSIFDVQSAIRGALERITDTSSSTTDDTRTQVLEQLLREANLRTAVSQAQYGVLANFDRTSGLQQFAGGGVVQAPPGQPLPVIAHGGEGVFTRDQMQAMGGGEVLVVVNGDISNVPAGKKPIEVHGRNVRITNRAPLPGGGGGRR